MTNEAKFMAAYPHAVIEVQRERGVRTGKRYYLVRKKWSCYMWAGCGDTKAQAWKSAANSLLLRPRDYGG